VSPRRLHKAAEFILVDIAKAANTQDRDAPKVVLTKDVFGEMVKIGALQGDLELALLGIPRRHEHEWCRLRLGQRAQPVYRFSLGVERGEDETFGILVIERHYLVPLALHFYLISVFPRRQLQAGVVPEIDVSSVWMVANL
jgi:hypothetical protein